MPEVPPAMRGRLYPTNLTARCPAFHGCIFCKGCQSYNRYSLVCSRCEEIKPSSAICGHSDEQQYTVKRLEEITRAPIGHPDQKIVDAPVPINGNLDYEQVLEGAFSGLGKISPIQEVK